ncbi:signal peptidase I [Microbacterium sulfonylureivorans]|uniref:signal peptidase I n=1 Tax=Microbacterium sulfonylureivorans TaxID=2486854 RepID=UPI0013DEC7DB|nr:signal peptidase I [Microbacterium sulfonylureivorans]
MTQDAIVDRPLLRRDIPRPPCPRACRRRLARFALVLLLVGVAASAVTNAFLVRSFSIASASMGPALAVDDRVLVDQVTPRLTGFHRGDIVVFHDPGSWLDAGEAPASRSWADVLYAENGYVVKRVVGGPGDRIVGLADGSVEVNGVLLDEPYARLAPQEPFDVVVPSQHLWVLGDNRGLSADSRVNGSVPLADVVGRAFWTF